VIDSNDFSTYHALQVMVQRKFTKGFQFQGSYTFSESLDTRSFDPTYRRWHRQCPVGIVDAFQQLQPARCNSMRGPISIRPTTSPVTPSTICRLVVTSALEANAPAVRQPAHRGMERQWRADAQLRSALHRLLRLEPALEHCPVDRRLQRLLAQHGQGRSAFEAPSPGVPGFFTAEQIAKFSSAGCRLDR
jgi:hypothetical protein